MSYTIVVARYNEDIGWLKPEIENCMIYNKGNLLNIPNEIKLENVGRESETYLQYIITNYDNLPEVVVFTQARISDHRDKDDVSYLINLKEEALKNTKSMEYANTANITNIPMYLLKKDFNVVDGKFCLPENYKENHPLVFSDWFIKHINPHYPEPMKFYINGIFAVKKELILNRPLEYYQTLIQEVNHHIDPTEGHFLERSWYYIFE